MGMVWICCSCSHWMLPSLHFSNKSWGGGSEDSLVHPTRSVAWEGTEVTQWETLKGEVKACISQGHDPQG